MVSWLALALAAGAAAAPASLRSNSTDSTVSGSLSVTASAARYSNNTVVHSLYSNHTHTTHPYPHLTTSVPELSHGATSSTKRPIAPNESYSSSHPVGSGSQGQSSQGSSGQGPNEQRPSVHGSNGQAPSGTPAGPPIAVFTMTVTQTVTAPVCGSTNPIAYGSSSSNPTGAGSGSSGSNSGSSSSGSSGSGSSDSGSSSSGSSISGSSSPGASGSSSGTGSSSGASDPGPSASETGTVSASSAITTQTSTGFVTGPTLLPAVHWDHPVDDIENLAPGNSTQLYYSSNGISDPNVQHLFASLSTTLQRETVILDHSEYVLNTTCDANGILVTFTNSTVFNYAATAWSSPPEFVLVTYTDGCGASDDQRTFWLIDSVSFQNATNSILAHVEDEIAIEDAIDGVDLIWGAYYPPGSNSASSGNTSSSGSSGNNTTVSGSGSTNSSASNGGSSCGTAPSSMIDGFPADACGAPDFDAVLDAAIGYFDFSSSNYATDVEDFIPDVKFNSTSLEDDDAPSSKRSLAILHKRGWWSVLTEAVSTVVQTAANVATAGVQLARAAINAVPVVHNAISSATELNPKVSGSADIKLGPNNKDVSPWGEAALLYNKASSSGTTQADVSIYCVNCGIKGHTAVAGTAKWNLADGLHALTVSMNANLEAGLNIGLVANAVFSDTKKKQLINQAIPDLGIAVKGVFAAGVFVSVDAVAQLDIKAEGQALLGVTMSFPNFQADLNLIDENGAAGSKVTGFTPEFKKTFEASGSIAASTTLSLPVALNVGLEITPLSFKKSLALIEEPSLYGNVTFAASTSGAEPASDTCNNGFEYFANAQNDIKFDFFGVKTFTLNHYDSPPLLQGCKLLDGSNSSSTSSSTSSDGSDGGTSTGSGSDSSSSNGSPSTGSSGDGSSGSGSSDSGSPGSESSGDSSSSDSSSSGGSSSNGGSSDNASGTDTKRFVSRQFSNSTTPSGSTVFEDDGEDAFGSDPNDASDDSDGAVDDDDSDPDNAEYQSDSQNAEAAAEAAKSDEGFAFTTIVESHNAFAVIPGEDGNLYAGAVDTGADQGAGLFAVYDGAASGDDGERVLHYYPDVMAAYGVSRLRLSDEYHIPKTADFIALQPLNYDDDDSTPNPLFAVTSKGDAYNIVLCNFSNGASSKLFIVSSETGLSNLSLEKLRYTVTGAPVSQCQPVALLLGTKS